MTDEKRKDLRELIRLLKSNMNNPDNKEIKELLDKKYEEFVKEYGEFKILGV
jgi:hypothetical protein